MAFAWQTAEHPLIIVFGKSYEFQRQANRTRRLLDPGTVAYLLARQGSGSGRHLLGVTAPGPVLRADNIRSPGAARSSHVVLLALGLPPRSRTA